MGSFVWITPGLRDLVPRRVVVGRHDSAPLLPPRSWRRDHRCATTSWSPGSSTRMGTGIERRTPSCLPRYGRPPAARSRPPRQGFGGGARLAVGRVGVLAHSSRNRVPISACCACSSSSRCSASAARRLDHRPGAGRAVPLRGHGRRSPRCPARTGRSGASAPSDARSGTPPADLSSVQAPQRTVWPAPGVSPSGHWTPSPSAHLRSSDWRRARCPLQEYSAGPQLGAPGLYGSPAHRRERDLRGSR